MKYKYYKFLVVFIIQIIFLLFIHPNTLAFGECAGQTATTTEVTGCHWGRFTAGEVDGVCYSTTTNYNNYTCDWNGVSCQGYASSSYCDSNTCSLKTFSWTPIACGSGGGGGGGGGGGPGGPNYWSTCPAGTTFDWTKDPINSGCTSTDWMYGQYTVIADSNICAVTNGVNRYYVSTHPELVCVSTAPPTTPTNLNAQCGANGQTITLSWSPSTNASNYLLRINNQSNDSASCQGGWNCSDPPDKYIDNYASTSYTFSIVANQNYNWWVHGNNSNGYSTAATGTFMCPSTPTTPTNLNAQCSADGQSATLSWSPSTYASNYLLRVNNTANDSPTCPNNGWNCSDPPDKYIDNYASTSYTLNVIPNQAYVWWVHGNNSSGYSSPAQSNFTCNAPTPSPTPVPASCTVTTSPASLSLAMGGTGTVTASVSSGLGSASVANMQFGSYNTGVAVVNPSNDSGGPTYSTTVTAIAGGSTAVWGTATLTDGRTCQSSGVTDSDLTITGPTPSPTPIPTPTPTPVPCTVTTSPVNLTLTTGGTGTVTASVSSGLGSASVTNMQFGSYNTSIATVNPSSDSSNPYSTTVTAVSGGSTAIWGTATLSDGRTCQSSGASDSNITISSPTASPSPTPAPCFVTTSPASASLSVGGIKAVTASVSSGLGSASVTNMQFGSYNTSIATVNPSSDVNSPFSTTVTAVSSGSTAVWATATLSDGRTCQSSAGTDTNISVTDLCTPPVISSISKISFFRLKIDWTHGTCDGNQQVVITQNGNPVLDITLPSTDTTYTTGNVLAPGSVYEVEIINSDSLGNQTSSNSTNTAPYVDTPQLYLSSCALSPSTSQLQVSQSATITSTVDSSSQINRVEFSSSNPSVITVTTPDSTIPYTTNITAIGAGNAVISSKVYFDNGVLACDTSVDGGNSSVTVLDLANSWWQLKDSDITSNGSLNSTLPTGNVFILPGAGGSSGIPTYSTTTNLTTSNVSSDGWITQNDNKSKPVFDYTYFENEIPKDVVINNIGSPSIPCSTFASGGTASYGYYWYRYDGGSGHIPLHITNGCNIGDRKVIVFVKNSDLDIDAPINLNDGVGFFMTVVDQNTNIDPSVGGGSGPNLEGFFITDNEFHSGAGTNSLEVRGSVVAYDGIVLERDLGVGNAVTPSELFEYAPDQSLLFPTKIATRKISWKEVAP